MRIRGSGKRVNASTLTPEDKLNNLLRKLAFCEREPMANEIEGIVVAIKSCQELLETLLQSNEGSAIHEKVGAMSLEQLEALHATIGGKNMRKMCKSMWDCVGIVENSAYALSSLSHTIHAKFGAAYAEYYHDAESYNDVAVMDHQCFSDDVQTAIDSVKKKMTAEAAVQSHAEGLQQQAVVMAQRMAQKLAEEMLANYLQSQQQQKADEDM